MRGFYFFLAFVVVTYITVYWRLGRSLCSWSAHTESYSYLKTSKLSSVLPGGL